MRGGQLYLLDPQLQPRPGQKVGLDYLGQEITGRITAVSGAGLEFRTDQPALLGHLQPDTHLRAVVHTRNSLSEVVLTRLTGHDDLVTGQIVGHPVSIERRADERVTVPLAAVLAWLDPRTSAPLQCQGQTGNVSVSGALLRFADPRHPLPAQDTVALLGLRLPDADDALTLSVRVLHSWQGGARVHVADVSRRTAERVRAFVTSRLDGAGGSRAGRSG